MYTLTNIGGVGGSRSEAFAINAVGVAVGAAIDIDGRSQGFAYEQFVQSFGEDTDGRGINSPGQIVGTQGGYATVWKGGSAERLGTLGGAESAGFAINDLGYVTGASLTNDGQSHAFLASGGNLIDLGALGGTWSAGYGINGSGQIAGSAETVRGDTHAFVWDEKTGMRDLGTIGGRDSRAMAINSSGLVAGASTDSARYFHATVWTASGLATDIGTLGGAHSYAYGLNDAGYAVGWSFDGQGRSRAFVWTGGMLLDLNDLVGNASGWSLNAAYGINSRGQIVGTGTYLGQSSAFRLDPVLSPLVVSAPSDELQQDQAPSSVVFPVPEPSTTGLIALGVALLLIIGHLKLMYSC
jgi:probable HAF family extracellular repeat protein